MTSEIRKDLTAGEFELFRDWIHGQSGIFLEEDKLDTLRISLVARATRRSVFDYSTYYDLLVCDDHEFRELMNLVTINETSFFRFPAQFAALKNAAIPRILAERPGNAPHRFRVWSAGCSTGEEPYTIAMTLLDSQLAKEGYRCEVLGTDVSTQALERAGRAVYPAKSLAHLEQGVVQRWFEPVKDGHRPVQAVRDLCDFHYHNLIKEPYPLAFLNGWDIIFCRNVTIYFRPESTRRVVDHFYEALNPGGYLLIGHSETLTSVSDRFEPVEMDGVFLYRKPLASESLTPRMPVVQRPPRATSRLRDTGSSRREASGRTRREPRALRPVPGPAADGMTSTSAYRVDTDAVDSLVTRAHALLDEAQPTEALSLATEALSLDPGNTEARLVAAFSHADLGELDDAVAQADAVLEERPLTAAARYILGVIHQQRGDMDAALSEFRRTVYVDKDFVLAHFSIANIHRASGDTAQACREYENTLRALHATPEGPWTLFLGGFQPDILARVCERSLLECGRGADAKEPQLKRRY